MYLREANNLPPKYGCSDPFEASHVQGDPLQLSWRDEVPPELVTPKTNIKHVVREFQDSEYESDDEEGLWTDCLGDLVEEDAKGFEKPSVEPETAAYAEPNEAADAEPATEPDAEPQTARRNEDWRREPRKDWVYNNSSDLDLNN
ncbi:hypothetical protein M9H77_18019 [Catharanthus roseus]|uniref:Uncharacterized protein n=1 Tax=Catharanthus roseus TaxID=4058 RepID=A0ACC0B6A3_CATRO|nr:hypothetical protein M9H77_18019 [Catharanthus roseus]